MFQKIPSQVHFPTEEKRVIAFWNEQRIFARSLDQRRGREEFVFYDGPPFATGLPHYGHLLAGTIKDVIPRYQTMLGKYVDRVFGWDCHGLPVENEMEKELGITSKHEIEAYGVDKFNEACRGIVLRYTKEWQAIVERIGRWVDFDHGYRTMDTSYMESIWWLFHELWIKDLIYEGHKVLPYCPRCATPLSNFEANQGYHDVHDPSITVRFRLKTEANTYVLAWTTTPWTLPSNLALAVGPHIDYAVVEEADARYILAVDRLSAYYKTENPPPTAKIVKGAELIGAEYEPLFPYFSALSATGAFRIVGGDFVSTADGTGIVHIAPGFGEDDARVGKQNGLPSVCPIDAECRFTSEVPDYVGSFVKECDKAIIKRLKSESALIHQSTIEHSYPHCWRCDSPLIYRAISTWFVKVEQMKERLLQANEQIRWVPAHLKHGRFGNWLSNAHDWAISRNRYWGCPLPIWRNQDTGDVVCVGSVAELERLCGQSLPDIHKHFVDRIELRSASGAVLRRVPEVLDCWFESGAMPYAQRHYPFTNKEWLEDHFPADFIAEGLDQTRGWFYTLVVLGTALFDKPAFRNVIVNGLVLAEDGRKMSKRLKNYPAPEYIMDEYGADALRLCLLSSPVLRGEDLRFSENSVKEIIRAVMLPLWNVYSFFVTYANVDGWTVKQSLDNLARMERHPLDRWILSQLHGLARQIRAEMDEYNVQAAACAFHGFTDKLTNWYVRRSRRRFWKSQNDRDKDEAYHTLYYTLIELCKVACPFIPFITESIYRNLRAHDMPDSVHLCDYPALPDCLRDAQLDRKMGRAITAVSLGRYLRSQARIRTRQPLPSATVVSMNASVRDDLRGMADVIAEELNVKHVDVLENEEALVRLSAKANFKKLGPRLGKQMKVAASVIETLTFGEIATLRAGGTVSIRIGDDQSIALTLEEIEIRREEKSGVAVANEGDITVALDTTLTRELELEGWARELVNRLQTMRKEMDLQVTDRIRVYYSGPPTITAAMNAFAAYIMGETLAQAVVASDQLEEVTPVMLGDFDCRFKVEKVER